MKSFIKFYWSPWNIYFQHINAAFVRPSNQISVDQHVLLSSKGGQRYLTSKSIFLIYLKFYVKEC